MTLKWREKVLLCKIEDTYGVDSVPTAAANAVLASDISIKPMEGADADRNLEKPFIGADGTIPHDLHMMITFKVELAGSGTVGTAPGWGPILRACGVSEEIAAGVSVTYAPVTDDEDSVVIYLNIGGILYKMLGTRGTAKFMIAASGIPVMEFTMTGLFTKPEDQAKPTGVDYSAYMDPQIGSNATTPLFTIDDDGFVLRSFDLDMGNEVSPRFLIGKEEIVIEGRSEQIQCQIEATALATFDPYAAALAQSKVPVVLTHGTLVGQIATISAPNAQIQRPDSPTGVQGVKEWPLRMVPLPVDGDDQWSLVMT